MDMLVSAVSVKLSVSGNGKVLLKETVFAVGRTSSVRPLLLSFQGDSPTPEPKFVGAFTHCHRFGKVGVQSRTDFFEPDRVGFQLSPRTHGMVLQTLQNTNQPVHVQIPEVNLCKRISFGHFPPFSAAGAALRVPSFNNRFRRMFRVLVGHTNSGAAQSPAARDKYPPCFQLGRRFRDRLRWDKNRGIGTPGKLRPE